jgi:ADP-ribose pyrophosphatase YjhB (NUDIX family)
MERKYGLGVYTCVFNKELTKILLLKRNKEKIEKYGYIWGNVGGVMDFGEYSIDAAIREAREEIGLDFKKEDLRLIKIKELPNYHKDVHSIQFIYSVCIDEKTLIKINEESEEAKWFDINNLPLNMIDSKEQILKIAKMAKEKNT